MRLSVRISRKICLITQLIEWFSHKVIETFSRQNDRYNGNAVHPSHTSRALRIFIDTHMCTCAAKFLILPRTQILRAISNGQPTYIKVRMRNHLPLSWCGSWSSGWRSWCARVAWPPPALCWWRPCCRTRSSHDRRAAIRAPFAGWFAWWST